MAISLKRYVDITSGVGAGVGVAARLLIGRFFSTNPLIPTNSSIDFDSADAVSTYFGSTSDEYLRAVFNKSLDLKQKVMCLSHLCKWFIEYRKRLSNDVRQAIKTVSPQYFLSLYRFLKVKLNI